MATRFFPEDPDSALDVDGGGDDDDGAILQMALQTEPAPAGHHAVSKRVASNLTTPKAKQTRAKTKSSPKTAAKSARQATKKPGSPAVASPALKMDPKNIGSRAYHKAMYNAKRSGLSHEAAKQKARAASATAILNMSKAK